MASSHRAKRPYAGSQPTITSYFPQPNNGSLNPSQSNSASPIPYSQTHESTGPPQPPHHVQVNLLSVGMRVRKSVPEGYKTESAYGAFSLFADTKKPTAPATAPATRTPARNRARELTPFCGIMKVGGLATQQWGIYNPSEGLGGEGIEEEEELTEDDVPFLSSQGSTLSNSSVGGVYGNANKRRFFGEDEDEEDEVAIIGAGERVIAVPRRSKLMGKISVVGIGQRSNAHVRTLSRNNDFEDAEFLDYDLAGEVEMGGV